jgi:hypothetical protein
MSAKRYAKDEILLNNWSLLIMKDVRSKVVYQKTCIEGCSVKYTSNQSESRHAKREG